MRQLLIVVALAATVTCFFPDDRDRSNDGPRFRKVTYPNARLIVPVSGGVLKFLDQQGVKHVIVGTACEVTS